MPQLAELTKKRPKESTDLTHSVEMLAGTVGYSLIGTSLLIAAHHLYRKKTQPAAKITDYAAGVKKQINRIHHANQQWLKTYKIGNPANQPSFTDVTTSLNPITHTIKPVACTTTQKIDWVSGVANIGSGESDTFFVVGIDTNSDIQWQTKLDERVHDIVVQPKNDDELYEQKNRHVAVMGRRPSERFWVLDVQDGKILHRIVADKHRHFYGHACYGLNGDVLYVTENNTQNFSGIIGVYDVHDGYRKVDEYLTHGIGPHELIMHPDGDKLVIANGGIKTERASREELNLDTMQPSLVYLDCATGELLQQVFPEHNQMSVRHIAAITEGELEGTVAIGIQFQGEKHLNMPLVLTHKFNDTAFTTYTSHMVNQQSDWRHFYHYIASVAVNPKLNLICATSPIGGCASVFDMNRQRIIDTIKITDCAGGAVADAGFLVSDGQGGLHQLQVVDGKIQCTSLVHKVAFDNHMQRVID